MARKSRNGGGATSARPAPTAQADAAPSGTGTAQLAAPAAADADADYPGKQFGLPRQGRMSVAGMGRRLLALTIDWLLSMVIAVWLTHSQYWTLPIFAVEVFVLTALGGSTVGKRLSGIRVIRTGGGQVGFRWALVRTILLLTVVLPLLTDYDRRGVHDRAADTVVVRI